MQTWDVSNDVCGQMHSQTSTNGKY